VRWMTRPAICARQYFADMEAKVKRGQRPEPGRGEVFVHNVGQCKFKPVLQAPD